MKSALEIIIRMVRNVSGRLYARKSISKSTDTSIDFKELEEEGEYALSALLSYSLIEESDRLRAKVLIRDIVSTLYDDITSPSAGSKSMLFNIESIKSQLLPILSLICLHEKSGAPEIYAEKLAVILGDFSEVINYLESNIKHNNSLRYIGKSITSPLIDACRFDLPKDYNLNNWHSIEVWQRLAKYNLNNPSFKNLLVNALDIEKMIQEDAMQAFQQYRRRGERHKFGYLSGQKLSQIKKSEDNISDILRSLKIKRQEVLLSGGTLSKSKELNDIAHNLRDAMYEHTKVCAGVKFSNASILTIRSYQVKHARDSKLEINYFIDMGLTEKSYAEFLTLRRVDDDKKMPRVLLDGADYGFPGYYMRRLDVSKRQDAILAATLGKKSKCCQFLSDKSGKTIVVKGLTSIDSGFYVLCKGNVNSIDFHDELIAQSWCWRSEDEAFVIDSVESIYSDNEYEINIIQRLYIEFVRKLIVEYSINRVCSGRHAGVTPKIFEPMFNYVSLQETFEKPVGYHGHRDTYSQILVASKYSLYHVTQSMEDFFSVCEKDALEHNHDAYIDMLKYAVINKKQDFISRYYELLVKIGVDVAPLQTYIEFMQGATCDLSAIVDLRELKFLRLRNSHGKTPLMMAVSESRLDIIEFLSSIDVDTEEVDEEGNTAFLLAAMLGRLSIMKFLVQKGSKVLAKNNLGQTALILSIMSGNIHAVQWLATEYSDLLSITDFKEISPLMWSAKAGKLDILKWLETLEQCNLSGTDVHGNNAFMLAVDSGRLDVVEWFLINGLVDKSARDKFGQTALMIAATSGQTEVFELLLKHGFDINSVGSINQTPLMLATESGSFRLVKLIIDNKAIIDVVDIFGDSALSWAAREGHLDIIQFLVGAGASPVVRNNDGDTLLTLAVTCEQENTAKWVAEQFPELIYQENEEGKTSVSLAEEGGLPELAEFLKYAFETSKVNSKPGSASFDAAPAVNSVKKSGPRFATVA